MSKRQTYGVPYQGSKNRLAEDIIALLPKGKRFVDLFAGGCAMTHCALQSGKWERVLCNDKYPMRGQEVFRQACEGEFNKPEYQRFIGHDEFMRRRYDDCWMIGIWGWNTSPRGYLAKWIDELAAKHNIQTIQQLYDELDCRFPKQRLTRLQGLSGLDLSKVEFSQMNYAAYEQQEGDVVYCDPPYEDERKYDKQVGFDNDAFWEWARTRDYPVYVSEFKAPDDFVSIWSKKRGGVQNGQGYAKNTTHIEHLFLHNRWI